MEYISKFVSNFKEYYNGINAATLTGAIDVVIVQQEDGSFLSSPFHVRFGKLGVLRSREKIVDIEINGDPVDIHMKLGESGEAFFVTESGSGDEDLPAHLATSPIPPFEMDPPSPDGTLMGQRDEGILSSSPGTADIVIGPIPEGVTVFKAETVVAGQVEGSFKPIQPAQEAVEDPEEAATLTEDQQQFLPGEETAASPDEERRKPYRRRRKRRSLNKKKTSKNNDDDDAEDVETTTTEESVPNTPRKDTVLDMEFIRGHRKSHSVTVIDFGPSDSSSTTVNDDWFNGPMSRSLGPGFHFFSDTEADMEGRETSRPPSPVHSDTEYEVGLQRKTDSEDAANTTRQSWRWGELPSPPVNRSPAVKTPSRNISRDHSPSAGFSQQSESQDQGDEREKAERKNQAERNAETAQQEEAKRSMLSHMFSFMRQTKKIRNQAAASGEGIYLDDLDLNDLDPELAALYFPPSSLKPAQAGSITSIPTHGDDDAESGRGPSLPQSPHSMATGPTGSKSGPRSVDSDFEDSRGGFHELRTFPDVAMSLCGNLNDMPELPDELFLQSLVSYDDFLENPRLLESPDLVVRIGSKYYNWQTACPIIMSWALYQRPLPQNAVDVLVQEYMSKRNPQQQDKKKTDQQTQQQQQQQQQRSGYSWFSWGKKEPKKPQDPPQEAAVSTSTVSSSPTVAISTVTSSTTSTTVSMEAPAVVAAPPVAEPVTTQVAVDLSASPTPPQQQQPLLEAKLELLASTTSSDSESVTLTDSLKKLPIERRSYYENTDKYRKTLRLSSEDVIKLNLRDGPNEAVFSVTTAYQGTTRCKCHIYLWKYDDKIVISDIDGTITKSDVLGHILPIVGKDWAQSGVAQLFTKIKNNGYRILYLSARAIGQARITRDYLRSVRQGDLCLPDGPLLLNPTSLLSAFHREVIEKKPEEFKISCLRDIQALFPSHTNPFYAGYGNKVNDVWAYRAVGIPISRIFTINHRGELKHELTQTFQSSYSKQSFIVDLVFPPLHGSSHVALENADFNEFSYWREPFQDLPMDINRFTTVYETAGSRSRRSSKIESK